MELKSLVQKKPAGNPLPDTRGCLENADPAPKCQSSLLLQTREYAGVARARESPGDVVDCGAVPFLSHGHSHCFPDERSARNAKQQFVRSNPQCVCFRFRFRCATAGLTPLRPTFPA